MLKQNAEDDGKRRFILMEMDPTVANGKVYVGTTDGVAVFGLLH